MAARLSKKNSAFLAFQGIDSDASDDERAHNEHKEKQKAKKKSSKKKKSSESMQLKGLAMVSGSKKSKSKSKPTPGEQPQSSTQEVSPPELNETDPPAIQAVAGAVKPTAGSMAPPAISSTTNAVVQSASKESVPRGQRARTTSGGQGHPNTDLKKKFNAMSVAETKPPPTSAVKPADDPAVPSPSVKDDFAAIYQPTHITVARADGQISRQIAVAEMMDLLVRFQQHNGQLTLANRTLQEQLQRDAGMIASLQTEVAMFRQMCLNLQAEVTQLRSIVATGTPGSNGTSFQGQAPKTNGSRPAPPPGMS